MKPVIAPPLLPYPSGNDIKSLRAFDADLRRALVEILTQYAFRINGLLPMDGSEPMTGQLNLFNDTDISSITQLTAPLNIGTYAGNNMMIDGNELQTRTNGVASSWMANLFGGNITFGDTSTIFTLNGGKIAFPATQQASAGANTLDDYEEGTWTPTLNFSGGTTGITYSIQAGVYVKIGQLVFVQGRIILTNKGSSTGAARIAGLPFASHGNSHNYTPISVGYFQNFVALPGALSGYVEISNSYINLTAHQATGIGGLNETHFSNTSDIIFSAVYRASA